jgi:hypothetical protein
LTQHENPMPPPLQTIGSARPPVAQTHPEENGMGGSHSAREDCNKADCRGHIYNQTIQKTVIKKTVPSLGFANVP